MTSLLFQKILNFLFLFSLLMGYFYLLLLLLAAVVVVAVVVFIRGSYDRFPDFFRMGI